MCFSEAWTCTFLIKVLFPYNVTLRTLDLSYSEYSNSVIYCVIPGVELFPIPNILFYVPILVLKRFGKIL